MIHAIRNLIARAAVHLAIAVSPTKDLSDELRKALGGGGGPQPGLPR